MTDLPAHADVAIIGGGFAGMATAWALARRGVAALVLEREAQLGRYASGRCAGLGRQLVEDDETTALCVRGAARLRELGEPVWRETGGVLAFDDEAACEAYAARAARFGVGVVRAGAADVHAQWPELAGVRIAAALRVPTDGLIGVPALLDHFARGARIAYGAGVARVAAAGRGARVETARGAIEARVVVDAGGAWAGAATGGEPLASLKRHLFVLEVERPDEPYVWHLGADELYVRRFGGHLLVSPCDQALGPAADVAPDERGDAALAQRLAATGWRGAPIVARTACQRTFAADRRMRLGRDAARPWLVWAAALGGHGATAAAAVGEVVADAALAALSAA